MKGVWIQTSMKKHLLLNGQQSYVEVKSVKKVEKR